MIAFALLLLAPPPDGAALFKQRCSVPYCHGANGTAGRAPALTTIRFRESRVRSLIEEGKAPGMPGFKSLLKADEIGALVAYLKSINTGSGGGAQEVREPRTPELEKARALFFDATRMGGCGRCHEVDGQGLQVGPNLTGFAAANGSALRRPARSGVQTVTPRGEAPFPGVPVTAEGVTRVFDLSAELPVLRTFAKDAVTLAPGGTRDHANSVNAYSAAELDAIAAFLRALR